MRARAALKIGLAYDLRDEYLAQGYGEEETAEFDQQSTIDALGDALGSLGYVVDRIGNAVALMQRLSAGDRWDLVFNIAEGLYGYGREAQVPAILDVYGIPYTFGDPLTASVCLHKAWSKTLVAAEGVPTAKHQLITNVEDCGNFALKLPVLLKPVAEGTGKGVTPESVITDPEQLAPAVKAMLARYRQPVLVEEFLPGREFTVAILGSGANARVLGSLEIKLREGAEQGVYSYVNKEQCESLVEYPYVCNEPVVDEAEAIALKAWVALGCRDGGRVDMRCDGDGHPVFMEVNPLAGLHPTHSDLPMLATAIGMSYPDLIREIVESATERVSAQRTRADSRAA